MAVEEGAISIIFEDPAVQCQAIQATQKSKVRLRRNHTKSRNGCNNCRQRRIKCNEARPECLYCWQKGISCRYVTRSKPKSPTGSESSQSSASPSGYLTYAQRMRAAHALYLENIPCRAIKNPTYKQSDALELFEYFFSTREHTWIASPACQSIMQSHVFELSLQATYLLHAVLAFSAAYLNFQDPADKRYRIASTLHYHKALNQYQKHLEGKLEEGEADAMMACTILLSLLAFVHTTAEPNQKTKGPAWVISMQGTQILSQNPTLWRGLSQGVWCYLMQRFDDWKANIFGTYLDLTPRSSEDLEQIRALAHLCAKHAPLDRQQLYKTPLFMLEYLAQLPPSLEVGNRFVYFVSILSKDFIRLLDAEDPFAMLMMAFWCAFLSRIDQWWISVSAHRECRRICTLIVNQDRARFDGITKYLLNPQSVGKHTDDGVSG